MLIYLREKRDVCFFQSMAGLMLSCRWVIAKTREKNLSDLTRPLKAVLCVCVWVCVCVSVYSCFQCSGSECIWEAEQSRRIRHGHGWELRYCIHMEIQKKNTFVRGHAIARSQPWDSILGYLCTLGLYPDILLFATGHLHSMTVFLPADKVMPDKDVTCDLFRFLQLVCEGHNSGDFSNMLRKNVKKHTQLLTSQLRGRFHMFQLEVTAFNISFRITVIRDKCELLLLQCSL